LCGISGRRGASINAELSDILRFEFYRLLDFL
jgi:hypothetical protein